MPGTIEERVAYLEGKVEEHSSVWQDLREQIRELSQRITHMEEKFDHRFAQIDHRFAQIDQRFTELDNRLSGRIDKLFLFILTTMLSSIGALIGVIVSIFVK